MATQQSLAIPKLELDDLDCKAIKALGGKVVRKDLTNMMKSSINVPSFVLEYLLGMYCATDDAATVGQGVARIHRILTENYVRADESEVVKSRIRELGRYTVIDKVSVRLNERDDCYEARLTNLQIEPFEMPKEYVVKYSKLLQGGVWCILSISYAGDAGDEEAMVDMFGAERPAPVKKRARAGSALNSRFGIASLKPIQMPNLDLDQIIAARREFTVREWMDFLLRGCGYEPSALSPRQKLHFLARLIPLIEHNYNLVELGPRGTGKSHVYKEVSPHAVLISGGQTTTANLFGRMNASARAAAADRVGLVGVWDCVTFDEVAGMNFKDVNAVQIMKDYMASGSFARGKDESRADASMVFEGNINDAPENVLKTTHLFSPFPPEFNDDSAFFDRIHAYLPGWEVPKMRSDLLTSHYGFITDCLGEFCHAMRPRDYGRLFDRYFRLNGNFNRRDEIGVRKTFSGLAKLLFPDERMGKEDARMLLEYAIESRRRVKEQLKIMAGVEFADVDLGYCDIDDPSEDHVVYLPEQPQGTLIPGSSLRAGHVFGVGASVAGDMAVYRLENQAVPGSFKNAMDGVGNNKEVKDSIEAAFRCLENTAHQMAAGLSVRNWDFLVTMRDLQDRGVSADLSLAEYVGLCSAATGRSVVAGMVIPGALRMSGTIDVPRNLEEVMRVAKNAGAQKILLPMGSIADLQGVSAELLTFVGPEFYTDGDPVAAARKALGL